MTRRRLFSVVTALLVVVVGAGAAWAAWTAKGTGSASAKSMTVLPATVVGAASAGTTSIKITVTTGPTDPTSVAPQFYRVDRVSPAATGVCYITVATSNNCTDTGANLTPTGLTPGTSYSYSIFSEYGGTATAPTWTSATGKPAGPATTDAASLTHSYSMVANTQPVAGSAFTVTITAKANNATDTAYGGTKTLDWTGAQTIGAFADSLPTSASFTSGVATVSLTLYKAGARSLTATDHNAPAYTGALSGTVTAGSPQLAFTATTVGGTAATCSATTAINPGGNNTVFSTRVQVLAQDTWGNSVTLASSGTISVTMALSPNSGFNTIQNNPQVVTLPTTTSPSGTPYNMSRSNGSSYTGTLTGSATGYASASCALNTGA